MIIPTLCSIEYRVERKLDSEPSEIEKHKQQTLAAFDDVMNLARLLQCVECDVDVRPEVLVRQAASLVAGVRTIGRLIVDIGDTGYNEVQLLVESIST